MRDPYRSIFVALVLVFGFAGLALADTMNDANAAWSRQDYATAARLYRSLAEQGRAAAQHQLAKMYENGEGVARDFPEALKWYRRAADQGHAGAQLYLGGMYFAGDGVPRDFVQADVWYRLSEAAGQGAYASQAREKVEKEMTPAQLAEANRRVREWRPTKAQ
jgi:TPR repeat protein